MARITAEQSEKYSTGGSDWLKLANDGDAATVQFLCANQDDLDIFAVHKVKINGYDRSVNCLREYDDPISKCPFCESGMQPTVSLMLAMVDVKEKSIKIWERGKTFIPKMQALFNRYSPLTNSVFDIERHGRKGDQKTTYEMYPVHEDPIDISGFNKPEFLGTVILDKNADEMNYYLDNQKFEDVDKEQDNSAVQGRGRRRG